MCVSGNGTEAKRGVVTSFRTSQY